MQIGLFEVEGDIVIPDQVAVRLLPWMRLIKEQFPDNYLQVYAYLFYMSCWDSRNIYINVPDDERESAIIEQQGITFSLDNPTIKVALENCQKLYTTPAVALLKAIKSKIDDIAKSLNTTSITYGKNGNADQISKFIEKSASYAEIYDKLDGRLKEEQNKIRGGKLLAYDQLDQLK